MQQRSRYANLHESFDPIDTPKAGTRYERLAARVVKILQEEGVVVHNRNVVGDSTPSFQIDILLELHGHPRRVLIECKDDDVSRDPVGLAVVQKLHSTIENTHSDGVIIASDGFTQDARIFAKSVGIKLVTMRLFRNEDWEGRLRHVHTAAKFYGMTDPDTVWILRAEEDEPTAARLLARNTNGRCVAHDDPIYVRTPNHRIQCVEFVQQLRVNEPRDRIGPVELTISLEDTVLEDDTGECVPLKGVTIRYENTESVQESDISANRIASFVVQDLEGTDLIIWEEDLRRYVIRSDTGEVVAAMDSSSP